MAVFQTLDFNEQTPDLLSRMPYGTNWPVVYVINNDKEAYIGETLDAAVRTTQHLQNAERRQLTQINIITDDTFNKSVILDLEAYLIKHMSADGKFQLQNGNAGLQAHNYFNRSIYEKRFHEIWDYLVKKNLASHDAAEIENSDLFKYSPFNALSHDQFQTIVNIVRDLADAIKNDRTMSCVVQGGPGTGKTILGVYLMKLLYDKKMTIFSNENLDPNDLDSNTLTLMKALQELPELKIAYVVPQQSLRETMKNVFGSLRGMQKNWVISPMQVPHTQYDLLIVDEAHRLRQRKALSQYPPFDKNNELLHLDKNKGTELDWIQKCSKYQVFFYDSMQSVKPSDIDPERFNELLSQPRTKLYRLKTQFRCKGGDEYIDYVRHIFSETPPERYQPFEEYDFCLFDDVRQMTDAILKLDKEHGLCRNLAGYAWKWESKNDPLVYDINIGGNKYRWNSQNEDWVNSPNAPWEIGCIHTVQGYDLNYAGIILGPEILYDDESGFRINRANYHDVLGMTTIANDPEALRDFILNIYRTLFTRGIRGTYVYACDPGLRNYLSRYIKRYVPDEELHHFIDSVTVQQQEMEQIEAQHTILQFTSHTGSAVSEPIPDIKTNE